MATILDIRRRIRSVISTRQITRAMKMISAARLRKAQDRALSARPYAQMLTNVLLSLVERAEIYDPDTGEPRHLLLAQRPEKNIQLVIVTGDKGLAGAFNANILRAATQFIQERARKNIDLETIGRKGRDFFRRRYPSAKADAQERAAPTQIVTELVGTLNKFEFAQAAELAQDLIRRYSNCEIDSVYLIYNEFKSVIAQRLLIEKVLPIRRVGLQEIEAAEEVSEEERERRLEAARSAGVRAGPADTAEIDREAAEFVQTKVDYIYEQPPQELFNALLPRYVAIQMFRAMLESSAAEHAARMTAMDAATNNASKMIDALTLQMNRVRQAKITKEIIEIVSGAAAL
ncbi:MAG TPA: ATP synthase F1 subunit gamma [Terriglobales bacterium]|nr:ATP synthase F1 subunit gamma [Terriglobales bacterium]